jgi:DNA-binding MarR family transcriptional regulator
MDRTTLTANLKPLERRGLLAISVDKEDRRSRRLALTRPGRGLLTKAFPIWKSTHADIERLVGSAADLREALRALS